MERRNRIARASGLLAAGLAIAAVAGTRFVSQWRSEPLFPSPAMTQLRMLSEWHEPLEGTAGDTEVYVYDSGTEGGTLLVLGGTHPNEPAAHVAAVAMVENLEATAGRVLVIPRANRAAFMHNDSQEAMVQRYAIETPHGARTFRNGSRFTNPVRQWPDPTIYINPRGEHWDDYAAEHPDHAEWNPGPGGQVLAGVDSRNLNRVYPGDPNGTLTEQIGHAILTMIREENVDLAIDFHEASPEYPTINVMVAHQRAEGIATWAELLLSDDGVQIATDSSSPRLRGLSHREWGDADDVLSVLFESANVSQGRLKGRTTEEQITEGFDETYLRAQIIQGQLNEKLAARAADADERGEEAGERSRRILYVEIPEEGTPMGVRAGRHITAAQRLVEAYNDEYFERPIGIAGLPEYGDLVRYGVGPFLHGPEGEPPAGPPTEDGGG